MGRARAGCVIARWEGPEDWLGAARVVCPLRGEERGRAISRMRDVVRPGYAGEQFVAPCVDVGGGA